ncbi:MAG: ribose ABC transporter permease, partial [Lachnospiraceae bacterium]|nr:ribose ABC transporter permease [Lachnospiraceae bacterium]
MRKMKIDVKKYVSWIILVVLVLFFSAFSPRFRQISNAITILRQVSINGILAVGLVYVL